MKVIIVDDERLAIEVLARLLTRLGGVEIVGRYTNPKLALAEMENLEVDVAFLDMEMGEVQGLALAEELLIKFPHVEVVFVTAYSQYALEAFDVSAIDYLLKPVSIDRLQKTLKKLSKRRVFEPEKEEAVEANTKGLFIQTMGKFRLLDAELKEVKWRTRKARELFVYLWHHRENAMNRMRIIEELWGDLPKDRAVSIMHTTVYQLRKTIREIGFENPVILINEQYELNITAESDTEQLQAILAEFTTKKSSIEKAIDLYPGHYLEEEDYFWALPVQEEIKQSFLKYLEGYVMREEDQHQHEFWEVCLIHMLKLEPYNEQYAYLLLDYYGKMKNKQRMIVLFQEFKEKWIKELGIDIPMEIVKVYEKHIK